MIVLLDTALKRVLSEEDYGRYLYRRYPRLGRGWGGPLNGQKWRCLMVSELLLKLDPVAIVETGTYRGASTEWFASFRIPVYSCEASSHNYGFSRARLRAVDGVNLAQGDSRAALRDFLTKPLAEQLDEPILFYLDAHWNADLPLAEEIDLIFNTCSRAAVLIDDFQVPGDPGYGYDDYGPGLSLIAEYVASAVKRHGLTVRYPTTPSDQETGAKRGVVLLTQATLEPTVAAVSLLGTRDAQESRPTA